MRIAKPMVGALFLAAAFVGCSGKVYEQVVVVERPEDGGPVVADASPVVPSDASDPVDARADGATPPPARDELLYVACLSQLAFDRPDKVFSFRAEIAAAGASMPVTMTALAVENGSPPRTMNAAGGTGTPVSFTLPVTAATFSVDVGTLTVPGAANPITQRDVRIEDAGLAGRYVPGARWCARMSGTVTQPVVITLEPERNVCLFEPVLEGGAIPTFAASDFRCPP